MEYRALKGTALGISAIGFGCGGNAGLMVRGTSADQERIVGRALELGINYFDNAPDYGDGAAEENLGRALRALKARPLITSKVEVREANLGAIAAHVVRSTEESLRRLGIECLDFVQVHNGPSPVRPAQDARSYTQLSIGDYLRPGGALAGLQRLVRDGKARYLGFVCRGNDAPQVRQLIDTGLFKMINVPYTLLNPTAGRAKPEGLRVERDYGDVITYAEQQGVGTAIYSPLAGGFLTDPVASGGDRHPLSAARETGSDAYRRSVESARALLFLRDGKRTFAQAAVRFVLMHPGVTTVLGGLSDMAQLEEITAVPAMPPLDASAMARIEAAWAANFQRA